MRRGARAIVALAVTFTTSQVTPSRTWLAPPRCQPQPEIRIGEAFQGLEHSGRSAGRRRPSVSRQDVPIAAAVCGLLAAFAVFVHPGPVAAEEGEMLSEPVDVTELSGAELKRYKGQKKAEESGAAPVLSREEIIRRQTTPSVEVKDEDWYRRAKRLFIAKCAGCHQAGGNKIDRSKGLFLADLKRNNVDEEEMRKILRYGKGKMPGYAVDCADVVDYTQCGVISPLSDSDLQDVQNFVYNRANLGWKAKG
mmetsp:Transcript_33872/g.79198  ORF Transcript_33872/g.79198 Transcript_33872/m.79198 type:complete len:251 (+) Transcript_33872:68-820(+)